MITAALPLATESCRCWPLLCLDCALSMRLALRSRSCSMFACSSLFLPPHILWDRPTQVRVKSVARAAKQREGIS